ncbi:MAG: aldehyde dehydrogenase family protein [Clostridiaceae bacterium]|nr:aldehyde dehydrogenase family protein [Clostridiaceae bacterium]
MDNNYGIPTEAYATPEAAFQPAEENALQALPSSSEALRRARNFFATGRTYEVNFRLEQLRRLAITISNREDEILEVLQSELNKHPAESWLTELAPVLDELHEVTTNLTGWLETANVKPRKIQRPAKTTMALEPIGVVGIFAPESFMFSLSLIPLIDALAAGNCVVLQTSAALPGLSWLISDLIHNALTPDYVSVIRRTASEQERMESLPFDKFYYSGNRDTAERILTATARNLTATVLDLNGKSPCIVNSDADIKVAARRIAYGKLLNAGQSCDAPDYVLVHHSVKNALVKELSTVFNQVSKNASYYYDSYPRIIDEDNYVRICSLLDGQVIIQGGAANRETLQIEPVLLDEPDPESAVMQTEICGPILPIVSWMDEPQMMSYIRLLPPPRALYLFSADGDFLDRMSRLIASDTVTYNDTMQLYASASLPYGGGLPYVSGVIRGREGLRTFSHTRIIHKRLGRRDRRHRFHPYRRNSLSRLRNLYRYVIKLEKVKMK